jgi:type II restriction/modification system DNA methylase subunit YeeA
MNRLIEEENGSFDRTYQVNWKLYANSLIITGDISVRIIPLKIHRS